MKVIESGTPYRWSGQYECTGRGNSGHGCGAKLLIEEDDLTITYNNAMGRWETWYLTFTCCECKVSTDIYDTDGDGQRNPCPDVFSKLIAEWRKGKDNA